MPESIPFLKIIYEGIQAPRVFISDWVKTTGKAAFNVLVEIHRASSCYQKPNQTQSSHPANYVIYVSEHDIDVNVRNPYGEVSKVTLRFDVVMPSSLDQTNEKYLSIYLLIAASWQIDMVISAG
ncbi:hypothetical protein ACUHMQ_02020 [Chitinimonas sp. PSY-7]|uniref:hypothetical protein n=1 Tax=Chitinimonas sp. PSY-7 TaxID=3459088 RepID=UPI0040403E5A